MMGPRSAMSLDVMVLMCDVLSQTGGGGMDY